MPLELRYLCAAVEADGHARVAVHGGEAEVGDHVCDFGAGDQAPGGRASRVPLTKCGIELVDVGQAFEDLAGCNRVDGYLGPKLDGERLGDHHDSHLGQRVCVVIADIGRPGAHVDDPAPAAGFHCRRQFLSGQVDRLEVDVHDAIPVGFFQLQEGFHVEWTGIVDDDVDSSEGCRRLTAQAPDFVA